MKELTYSEKVQIHKLLKLELESMEESKRVLEGSVLECSIDFDIEEIKKTIDKFE